MCALMFKSSHRLDGKIADMLASTHSCTPLAQLRMLWSTTAGECSRDLQKFPTPPREDADVLAPTLVYATADASVNYTGGACHRDLENFPSPPWEAHVCPACCFQGSGVYVRGGTVTISSCTISGNSADYVRAHVQKFPSPQWENC
jgi:hypothetical protein